MWHGTGIWDVVFYIMQVQPFVQPVYRGWQEEGLPLVLSGGYKNYAPSIRTMKHPRPDLDIVKIPHKSSSRLASMMHDVVIEQLHTRLMKKNHARPGVPGTPITQCVESPYTDHQRQRGPASALDVCGPSRSCGCGV